MSDVKTKITRARTSLIMEQPFFGSIALKLLLEERSKEWFESQGIPSSMGTDGKRLIYCPDFVAGIEEDELEFVLAHEVMHVAMSHAARLGERHYRLWNMAADYAINSVLDEAGFHMPKGRYGGLLDKKYEGMSADSIYAQLMQQQQSGRKQAKNSKQGAGQGNSPGKGKSGKGKSSHSNGNGEGDGEGHQHDGQCGCGGLIQPKNSSGRALSEAEKRQMEQDAKQLLAQAAQVAKMQGNLPAGLERFIDNLLNPKVDWRDKLRRFLELHTRNDYSWMRPNRRYIGQEIMLPSLHSLEVGTVVCAIDTSGSISPEELRQFCSELSGMLEAVKLDCLYVIWWDADVAKVDEYTSDDLPIKPKPAGGGGTAPSVAVQWMRAQDIQPVVMIYLTDGCFAEQEMEGNDPGCPVLWITTGEGTLQNIPFGEVVEMEIKM